ncbi:SHOCT domain-containing protein [Hymenobacter lapidiphilus]|uniref:SHOCT domain-containing protein n=1 Tax=Hymenobacter lapidiphilus TaxID=2608003 RepID=A0A7Y7PNC5_9BACT|nr:SHOCT domain-containing protein [Hymenobacter lapidiphilus]NVO30964.1 SHOCT domain-containing protein [Hymenobacter lapidiphilus]
MEKDLSPLDTLRQLKEWLDAGTITPDEFQTLKQKLVFAPATPAVAPEAAAPEFRSPELPEPGPTGPEVSGAIVPGMMPELPPTEPELSAAIVPDVPPAPPVRPEPTTVAPVEMMPMLPPVTHSPATGPYGVAEQEYVEEDAYTAPRKSPLMTIVVVASILALLALVAYLLTDGRDSERLTSTSRTTADSVAVAPEVGPQTEQIELPPIAAPETIRVAPVVAPIVAPAPADTAVGEVSAPPAVTPAPAAADASVGLSASAAKARVETIMQRYYTDLQAPPFTATAYFAPQIERFYLMQNTTPAAISAELARTHFPEFLEAQTSIRPGTLQVGTPVADGSRVVTFVENSTALRQSLQKRQQTAAQMRVRFDKDFKIVYLRQEKLLENNFEE